MAMKVCRRLAQRYLFEGYELDADSRSVRGARGEVLALTSGEFALLLALVERAPRVLSRDQLLDLTRGAGDLVGQGDGGLNDLEPRAGILGERGECLQLGGELVDAVRQRAVGGQRAEHLLHPLEEAVADLEAADLGHLGADRAQHVLVDLALDPRKRHALALAEHHGGDRRGDLARVALGVRVGDVVRHSADLALSREKQAALALIERGFSLVADDLTYLRLLRDHEVVGRSSEISRGYMECRGIGIIDIGKLFGVHSVRLEKRVDLVITFVAWAPGMKEERTGLNQDFVMFLDQQIPHMVIPVRPGRDLARLVEVAAMVQAQRLLGHDSAKEFNERLIRRMVGESAES